MVDLRNIADAKMKQKLMVNQSDEISNQFHLVISTLEDELSVLEQDKKNYSIDKATLKKLLLSSHK